jgi:hypothetical protein
MRPGEPLPWYHWDSWICFRGLIETDESASAMSLRPLKPLPRSQWGRGSQTFLDIVLCLKLPLWGKLCCWSFLKDSAVSMKPPNPLPRSHWTRWICFRGSRISCLNETMEAAPLVSLRLWKPLWHHGSLCENDYWLSIPLMGQCHEISDFSFFLSISAPIHGLVLLWKLPFWGNSMVLKYIQGFSGFNEKVYLRVWQIICSPFTLWAPSVKTLAMRWAILRIKEGLAYRNLNLIYFKKIFVRMSL